MVYADYNGSAPLCTEVKNYLIDRLQNGPFANPNTIHALGVKLMMGLDKCRKISAEILGAKPNQIIYNSGSSEGISHVFFSVLNPFNPEKKYIILSQIEHSAVLNSAQFYKTQGYELLFINTLPNGIIDLKHYQELITNYKTQIALVSVMAANNETGIIQPLSDVIKLAHEFHIPVFSDTTQFIGKTDFHFGNSGLDFAVLSGHKIGALVGSGLVLVREPKKMKPHIFGGGQEQGLRGGTQNYIGIETIAVALNSFQEKKQKISDLKKWRENFEKNIKEKFPRVEIIGSEVERLASTTLIAYPGIHGQAVQIELEAKDIYVTTSSACSDNDPHTSKVLKAMKVADEIGRGVIRISLCLEQNENDYKIVEKALSESYEKLAKIKSY
jgi:cysteine desulfurase